VIVTGKLSAAWMSAWTRLRSLPAGRALRIAVGIWVIYGAVIAAIVAVQPDRRTVTTEYQRATSNWWGGEKSLYRKKNGYLYLPQFAMLYTPYELLPDRVGEPLWRVTCIGLLAFALLAAASRIAPGHAAAVFLAATLLVLPSTFASARNGQVNLPLAALFLFIALALARERWWLAACLLGFTLAMKPIAIAPVLVCAALYPRLRLPMAVMLIAFAAAPFLHPRPAYAAGEYVAFFKNLTGAGNPTGDSWCDFAGMLRRFGLELPSLVQLATRALAGLATLVLCWRALRALDPLRGAVAVVLMSVVYLMLFNPRTETNSYVMLAAFVALIAACDGVSLRLPRTAAWLTLFAIVLGSENYGWPIFPLTNLWLKALATCFFAAWLITAIFNPSKGPGFLSDPDSPTRA